VAKADVLDALQSKETLPSNCAEVLELRKEAAKSSTAKIEAMLNRFSENDHRVRNTLQFNGANTGRWSGRGIQMQNFSRGVLGEDEIEAVFKLLKN
jgi:DNA polymerase